MTYVRKGVDLRIEQGFTSLSSDLILLRLISHFGKLLHVINFYNEPPGSSCGSDPITFFSLPLILR